MTAHDSLHPLAASIARRETTAVDVTRAALDSIALRDPVLHAFLEVHTDDAIRQAGAIDARLAAGELLGPLAGVPVAVKDNICVAWGHTTCASRMLQNYRSPFHATAVERLLAAGAVIAGKTNLDEFAMGSSTELSAFGPTMNPRDPSRVPGGSSGGSAAAVASGMVPLALGSDTGGSVRQPAAFCGCVGLKPTYGRVSRYGLVAYASSLDQIGTLATTVADAALFLQVIAGIDDRDATTSARPVPDWLADLDHPIDRLVVGVPTQALGPGLHPGVRSGLDRAIAAFRSLGADIREVSLPHADHAIAAYYLVACAEASSNLARFDGVRFGRRAELSQGDDLNTLYSRSRSQGLGPEVQRRIMLGTYALSSGYYDAYYATAMKARRLIKHDYDTAFGRDDAHDATQHANGAHVGAGQDSGGGARPKAGRACHVLLMPTTPTPAFKLGEKLTDPLALYLEDIFTVGVNLAGLPAISIPAGTTRLDAAGQPTGVDLPVGVQLIAPPFDESTLLRAARMLEAGLQHHQG